MERVLRVQGQKYKRTSFVDEQELLEHFYVRYRIEPKIMRTRLYEKDALNAAWQQKLVFRGSPRWKQLKRFKIEHEVCVILCCKTRIWSSLRMNKMYVFDNNVHYYERSNSLQICYKNRRATINSKSDECSWNQHPTTDLTESWQHRWSRRLISEISKLKWSSFYCAELHHDR